MSDATEHSTLDDIQGLSIGIFVCGLGVHLLTVCGLVTGQTAGAALILSYLTGWRFGVVFFVLNLPFFWLGWSRLGTTFLLKSLLSVTLLSVTAELLPLGFTVERLSDGLGAAMFGTLTGVGLLAVFRHGGSLGGVGVLGLILQERIGVRAGHVQLAFDVVLFAVAAFLFPPAVVAWSLLGAAILNLIIAVNHRRDRYVAT